MNCAGGVAASAAATADHVRRTGDELTATNEKRDMEMCLVLRRGYMRYQRHERRNR